MIILFCALLFCCLCSVGCVLILTRQQRSILREIRLVQARCAMLEALEKMDQRIEKGNFAPGSLTVAFQQFAWEAKDFSAVFTMKSFWSVFWGGMEQFAFAQEFLHCIDMEMSRVPRLNHSRKLFLRSFFQFMRYRHPVFTFLLILRNHWMLWRYQKISGQFHKKFAEIKRCSPEKRTSFDNETLSSRAASWRELFPVVQVA